MGVTNSKPITIDVFGFSRASLGESLYRSISTPERFSPDHLLYQLNMSEEHDARPGVGRSCGGCDVCVAQESKHAPFKILLEKG